ncbi:hypothetical protein ACQU0X_26945 [Pseudovibrio ascidiaceicola]|uniref:hypothetical protein n=1 Tax=Pseudovibrio ascidiaceicola TaxID=285279 RepID=UPI003D3648B6
MTRTKLRIIDDGEALAAERALAQEQEFYHPEWSDKVYSTAHLMWVLPIASSALFSLGKFSLITSFWGACSLTQLVMRVAFKAKGAKLEYAAQHLSISLSLTLLLAFLVSWVTGNPFPVTDQEIYGGLLLSSSSLGALIIDMLYRRL